MSKLVNDRTVADSRRLQDGITALHSAAEGGHVDAVRLLLEKGADVMAATKASALPRNKALRRVLERARQWRS